MLSNSHLLQGFHDATQFELGVAGSSIGSAVVEFDDIIFAEQAAGEYYVAEKALTFIINFGNKDRFSGASEQPPRFFGIE